MRVEYVAGGATEVSVTQVAGRRRWRGLGWSSPGRPGAAGYRAGGEHVVRGLGRDHKGLDHVRAADLDRAQRAVHLGRDQVIARSRRRASISPMKAATNSSMASGEPGGWRGSSLRKPAELIVTSDHRRQSGHRERSKPSNSANTIEGSGAAISRTTSAVPFAAVAATSPATTSRTRSECRRTALGVNRPDTSRRCWPCRGSSRLIMDALISISGRLPRAELYRAGSRSMAITSANREMPQSWFTGSQ